MAILKTKSGSSFNTKTGVKTSATGQTTQVRAAKPTQQAGQTRSDFLKSLNTKGSSNYQATSDDEASVDVPEVDTSQPSPTTAAAQATAGLPGSPQQPQVPFAEAIKGINPNDRATIGGIAQKYQQAAAQLKGTAAPQDAGTGKMQAGQALSQFAAPTPVSPLGGIMEVDSTFDSILTNFDKYFEPPAQKKTLLQEYESMSKALGISGLNAEILDAKRIIEGVDDDIRAEITASGTGTATESQVAALGAARSKSLLKNYQFLLDSRDNAMTQLSTMMNLTMEDRKAAENEFDRKLGFASKVAEFQQRATDNSRNQLNKLVDNIGYGGLLAATNGSVYEQSIIEKTLGLGAGGLAKAASYVPPMSEMDKLDLEGKKLSNAKLRQDLRGTGGGGISSTTQAIINNPSLFNDLTPTVKGQVITELQGQGYDTSNLGVKGLSDTAIQTVAQTQKALDDLNYLKTTIQGKEDLLGPITGFARLNPYSDARKLQADVDRVRQTVGKALEGGVLRKEDEEKYKKILATLNDTPETAMYKIEALISSITRDIENYKSLQQSSGRSLDVGASLQKAGSTTKTEDLRAKYGY